MKWLFPAVCGGVVLALAVSFPRAQDTTIEKAPATEAARPDNANPTSSKERAPDGPAIEARPADKTNTVHDPQAKLPAGGNSPTKRADVPKDAAKADGVDDQFKIFRLQRASATSACNTITQLCSDEFNSGKLSITADARTNSLLARGPSELLSVIESVLLTLDDAATVTRDDASKSEAEARPDVLKGRTRLGNPLADQHRQHEDQAARLAAEYRNQLAATPADRQKLDRLKAELQAEVSAAFEARQVLQRADLDRLRDRLAQIEHHIDSRQQRAQEIINNRIEELLHPEKQWEAGDDAAAPSADSRGPDREQPRRRVGERLVPDKPRDGNSAAAAARAALAEADKPLALGGEKADFTSRLEKKGYANAAAKEAAVADLAAKEIRREHALVDLAQAEKHAELIREDEPRGEDSSVSFVDRPSMPLLRERGSNPRKALLDAESAIATARVSAAQAEKALTHAREMAQRISQLAKQGAVPRKELVRFKPEVAQLQARPAGIER